MSGDRPSIGFGGGCHWCTEAVFAALRGVETVEQGFIRSRPPDDSFSEAVQITWNPDALPLDVLIEVHLRTHASTSNHKMRGKYRSAIYAMDDEQARDAGAILERLRETEGEAYVTRVLPFAGFKASDDRFHNYAEKNAGNQFCTRYIDPKLDRLRATHSRFLNDKERTDERI